MNNRKPLGQASRPRHLTEQTLPGGVLVPSWVTKPCCRAPESYFGRFLSGKFACWSGKIPFFCFILERYRVKLRCRCFSPQWMQSLFFPPNMLPLLCASPSCRHTNKLEVGLRHSGGGKTTFPTFSGESALAD